MMISADALSLIVSAALAVTMVAPVVLVGIWINDWRKGRLW